MPIPVPVTGNDHKSGRTISGLWKSKEETRNVSFFQVGSMRFLKQCLRALPPSPFPSSSGGPTRRPPAFSTVSTDREIEKSIIKSVGEGTFPWTLAAALE